MFRSWLAPARKPRRWSRNYSDQIWSSKMAAALRSRGKVEFGCCSRLPTGLQDFNRNLPISSLIRSEVAPTDGGKAVSG